MGFSFIKTEFPLYYFVFHGAFCVKDVFAE